jgi:hypothetical protein
MNDFYQVDFLDVETSKSGDAICLRYQVNGVTSIHVVDGGFQDTGKKVVEHIRQNYDNPFFIDRVIVSHPDGDHAGGLRTVLEELAVAELWMLRPWLYASELISRFSNFSSVENLKRRLKEIYPNIAALEKIALERGVPIYEPFQGAVLGEFTVLAPSKKRYLDLIVSSERTPESLREAQPSASTILTSVFQATLKKTMLFLRAAWGSEVFSPEETSSENEMSTVQYAFICGKRVLLTADAGRGALTEAADYVQYRGLQLPGVDCFQVPHHGSRRNLSTEILDRWLGPRLAVKPSSGQERFSAIISSAKEDEDHPRKAVVRALIHRGARVVTTEGKPICHQMNKPRAGWNSARIEDYPDEQEN